MCPAKGEWLKSETAQGTVDWDTPRKLTCPLKIMVARCNFLLKWSLFLGHKIFHFRPIYHSQVPLAFFAWKWCDQFNRLVELYREWNTTHLMKGLWLLLKWCSFSWMFHASSPPNSACPETGVEFGLGGRWQRSLNYPCWGWSKNANVCKCMVISRDFPDKNSAWRLGWSHISWPLQEGSEKFLRKK